MFVVNKDSLTSSEAWSLLKSGPKKQHMGEMLALWQRKRQVPFKNWALPQKISFKSAKEGKAEARRNWVDICTAATLQVVGSERMKSINEEH